MRVDLVEQGQCDGSSIPVLHLSRCEVASSPRFSGKCSAHSVYFTAHPDYALSDRMMSGEAQPNSSQTGFSQTKWGLSFTGNKYMSTFLAFTSISGPWLCNPSPPRIRQLLQIPHRAVHQHHQRRASQLLAPSIASLEVEDCVLILLHKSD